MGNYSTTEHPQQDGFFSETVNYSLSTAKNDDYIIISKSKSDKYTKINHPKINTNDPKQFNKFSNTSVKIEDNNINSKLSATPTSQRIIIYYSPAESPDTNAISLTDIANNVNSDGLPYINVVEICTLHLCEFSSNTYIHLNDYSPDNSMFSDIKSSVSILQSKGITVLFMIGGWEGTTPGNPPYSQSTWLNLFNCWDTFYSPLINLITEWNIDGIDLDIELSEQWNSKSNYDNVCYLLKELNNSFDDNFIIILVPVASAIYTNDTNGGLSGFNYKTLINDPIYGKYISWLNLQFYNGFGSLTSTTDYEMAINDQGYDPNMLVAGIEYCSDAGLSVKETISSLSKKYSNFGGVFVWWGNDTDVTSWSKTMYGLMDDTDNNDHKSDEKTIVKKLI